jgi:hypothetical protein
MRARLGLVASALFACTTAAHALPSDQTFIDAGLGPSSDWTLLGPQTFGAGGNGFLADGGGALYSLRRAEYDHRFGTADTSHGNLTPIFDMTAGASVSDSAVWVPAANPFVFYFESVCTDCWADDGIAFSDGFSIDDPDGVLDFAIYQSNSDPNTFAFFFDDGGGGGIGKNCTQEICDDNDFNDMVILVQGRSSSDVPEPGALAVFGIGLTALGLMMRRRRR